MRSNALLGKYISGGAVAMLALALGPLGCGVDGRDLDVEGASSSSDALALVGVRINEVESNGGIPGDWVELLNTNAEAVDISGWHFRDGDDTHNYVIPAGTIIASDAFLLLEEAQFNFGLGGADATRLYDATDTLVDSYSWTAHAVSTYGRCPAGVGAFRQTFSTRGAANNCDTVKLNEIESSGGVPGDWVELTNVSPTAIDVSGWIFKDNDDTHGYVIAAGTSVAPGAFVVLNELTSGTGEFNFGLGSADSARLYDTALNVVDSYSWTAHAATTYARCPDGAGAITTSTTPTKGAANDCGPGGSSAAAWPGANNVTTADAAGLLGGNISDLYLEPGTPNVLWAVRNGPGSLERLVQSGSSWTRDTANDWGAGKILRFADGTGDPDAEGMTRAELSSSAIYVATERNNSSDSLSRMSILRYDTAQAGTTLVATNEWQLNGNLPVVGANVGLEALTWIPDSFLVANSFFDEAANHTYVPAEYPNHGTGLFFVGLETNGNVYGYALDHVGGGFTRIATFSSGATVSKSLYFDREVGYLWSSCGSACNNQVQIFSVDRGPSSPTRGKFQPLRKYAGPTTMGTLANEGIALAPQAQCVGGFKPFLWCDDGNTAGHVVRTDTVPCGRFIDDPDADGVLDPTDNCPTVANASQLNTDGDATGDACDTDDDGDGVLDTADNCALVANASQANADGDAQGDACDACALDAANDADGDGRCADVDNCPSVANASQSNSDGDATGDACDVCPLDAANDADGDGLCANVDNCPALANPTQADQDADGLGDACDADDDGDQVADATDLCPNTAAGAAVSARGCSIAQIVPCNGPWKNHGQYVAATTAAVAIFVLEQRISVLEGLQIIVAAAHSSCGR